ncbi:MAG TPA: pilus assembly protein [Clostridiales bacterium]|nr:pilus assembly protein [Clostridiales bacterium]
MIREISNIFNSKKGSFTIETAIIIPFVFFCIIGLLIIPVMLYRKASVQILTDLCARRGARVWDDMNTDINTGKQLDSQQGKSSSGAEHKDSDDYSGGSEYENIPEYEYKYSLYWNLYDKYKGKKEIKLKNWLLQQLKNNYILYDENANVDIKLKDYFIFKKLNSQVTGYYNLSAGIFPESFLIVKSDSEVIINKPWEFIRNVDFIIDIERQFEESYPGFKEFMEKIRGTMDDIKKKIGEMDLF